LLIRDVNLSVRDGAIAAWPALADDQPFTRFAEAIAKHAGFTLDTPLRQLDPLQQRAILQGTGDAWLPLPGGAKFQYKGLYPAIDEASRVSFVYRARLDHLVSEVPCSACAGARLRDDAAAVRFADRTVGQMGDLPVGQTLELFQQLKLTKQQLQVAGELLREVRSRLQFL